MYKIKKTALNRSRLLTGTYKTVWSIVRAVLLIGLSFIILYPLIYMVSIAFRPLDELFDPSVVWIPKHLTLKNIKFAMEKMNMLKPVGTENSLFNSVVVNLLSALLQVASTAFVGYGFARFEFKLRGFLFGVVIFTMVVPVNSIIIPLFLNYRNLHLLDSYFAFYIPAILGQGIRSGLFIFIFRQFFKGMP
ncbi:MAG TPA: carbohydrate ABC transporter permease, partial [Ruminococcaceae bacterium]|nr:carbohydrate ABC transporter permease [Oscillospiraceae bacterium]